MTQVQEVISKEKYILDRVAEEGRLINKLATELSYLKTLEESNLLQDGSRFKKDYVKKQMKVIKNSITNIYLMLDLHEVQGMCDDVYNKKFEF